MTTPGATEAVTPEQTVMSILRKITVLRCGLAEDSDSRILIGSIIERAIRHAEANALRRAAELADTFGETILCMWDRPGGPPGNGYAPLRGSHVASAIRSLLPKEEGK